MSISDKCVLEIAELSAEAEALASGGAADRARSQVLVQRIRSIREVGLSTDEIRARYAEALAESARPKVTEERYRKAFFSYIRTGEQQELRDLLAGTQSISYTQGASGGYTVPIEYEREVFEAMAWTDPILSDKVCDFTTEKGETLQPKQLTGYDLSAISASQVNETVQQTAGTVPSAAGRVLRGNIVYKLSLAASIEAEDDVPDVMGKFARAYGVGFARKLGADAINGNGSTQPQGLFTALGPASWATGTGKITLTDIMATYFRLDRAYRGAKKAGWLCNDAVYQRIRLATDNSGRPLLSVKDDKEELMGKPLYVSPTVPFPSVSIGIGALIFGDLGHFKVRASRPTIRRSLQQGVSDITRGECLYVGRIRMDSALFDPSGGAAPPVVWAAVNF